MTRARKSLISLEVSPYYHICVRTVRQSFLCGDDRHTGKNFDHRKQWLEDELLRLANIFAIDITAYAILSNHYHVILHVDHERTARWEAREIIKRWHRLFKGSKQSHAYLKGEALKRAERSMLDSEVATWQERLSSISWFMRVINEKIARLANAEDGCKGRFWNGRFRSQALLDEKALLACMAYVDLNPIRAGTANTPEESAHTSIKRRIEAFQKGVKTESATLRQPKDLEPFAGNSHQLLNAGIGYRIEDYLELIDWTGRQIREDKVGRIEDTLPPILTRLGIERAHWIYLTQNYQSSFKFLVGSVFKVREACRSLGWKKSHSLGMSKRLFG
jgi:REP element-mobilizing transposase RayT